MNSSALKKHNLFRVIEALKRRGPLTKPELMRETALTSASVHNFMSELLERELVTEEGSSTSNGGRKALIYRFNARYRYILGVYISLHAISCCVIDLDFNEKLFTETPIDLAGEDVQTNLNRVIAEIRAAIEKSGLAPEDFVGIGVTVPGAVNRERGVILSLVNAPSWRNIPLKETIEAEIGLPAIVDKDNCGVVLNYKWTAQNSANVNNSNVVHISVTDGIGAGILLGGSLFRGNHHVAGEIGHMSVDRSGEACNCGNKGCLELYASDAGIVRHALEQIKSGEETALTKTLAKTGALTIEDVVAAAEGNDALACRLFIRAAELLVMAVGNILRLYDPDEIVFDCFWLERLPDVFSMIINGIFENTRIVARSDVKISLDRTPNLLIMGAATLVYEEIFGSADTCPLL